MGLFNWKIKELELQSFIEEAFENLGYTCENFHLSGAAWEDGIDILLHNSQKKIAIAVKISPKSKDIDQLKKLDKIKSDKKIYIYLGNPTKPFSDELHKLDKKKNFEIFNEKYLHDFLIKNKSTRYISKYFFNSDLFRNLTDILFLWKQNKNAKKVKPTNSDLNILWKWKDKQVSFYKVSYTLYYLEEKRIKKIETHDPTGYLKLVEEIRELLDHIDYETSELKGVFEEVKKKNPGLLSTLWPICRGRSGWFNMFGKIEQKENKEEIFELLYKRFFLYPSKYPYDFLLEFLYKLQDLAGDLELSIDWLFEKRKK